MSGLSSVVLWLFVINLGIASGAGLYESRVVLPGWTRSARESWPDTGLKFWAYVTTVPLTLLTIASLWVAWWSAGSGRDWWLAAALVVLVERISTFAYFIPAMVSMQRGAGVPDAVAKSALARWLRLNMGRHALTFLGWVAALQALVLQGR